MNTDKLDMLNDVSAEVARFQKKLKTAIEDEKCRVKRLDTYSSSAKFAACKRSALDLKSELSKLTLLKR